MRNHLGQYECRLCLTLHNNEGNYLAHTQARAGTRRPPRFAPRSCRARVSLHEARRPRVARPNNERLLSDTPLRPPGGLSPLSQGRRHQQNLAKRAAREAAEQPVAPAPKKRTTARASSRSFPTCARPSPAALLTPPLPHSPRTRAGHEEDGEDRPAGVQGHEAVRPGEPAALAALPGAPPPPQPFPLRSFTRPAPPSCFCPALARVLNRPPRCRVAPGRVP